MASIESTQDLTERIVSCMHCGDRFATVQDSIGHPCFTDTPVGSIAMVRQEQVAQQESAMLSDEYDNSLRVVRLPDWLGWALCLGTGVLTIACLILAAVFAA